ncbi:hypothetical protein [Methanonatronarchaeum sp. AMET-Sl]|uniref:hypothetical protein n=1 Tax=Methanonatronarchaeum sp. AMET-Sl TaxID=3037654 RepID=UPI00244DA9BE|nr:hypothetical protein [Methanonatronarchaeum sp. AMET-Sl]WGI17941.1 hypothetical protein QEN48_02755 [Methanonatronarchaeum sp. AMET-Sl]
MPVIWVLLFLVKASEERLPLPNNPYKIYRVEVNGKTYPRVPLPRYVALMLGLDPESMVDEYQLEIYVDRKRRKVEFELIEEKY